MKTKQINDYNYLINQLDLLIGFLDVSDEKIYNKIKKHDRYKMGITIEELYNKSYENYSSHISNSAFLLGFTHFEDFLTKRVKEVLINHPVKNDFKVSLKIIQEKGDGLTVYLAFEQAKKLSVGEKLKFIKNHIEYKNEEVFAELMLVKDVRNCLMHNNGIADERLRGKYIVGEKIRLTSGEVNGLGLLIRQFAKELWDKTKNIKTKDLKKFPQLVVEEGKKWRVKAK